MRTNSGIDFEARALGGDISQASSSATSTGSTSLTNTGATFPTTGSGANQGLTGHMIVAGSVYGIILSNTSTVITIDMWHNALTPDSVGSTPGGTTTYLILPGQAPAWWMGLSENTNAPDATDTQLSTTVGGATNAEVFNSGGGLNRALCTYAHTGGAASYTLSKQFTANASDSPPKTPAKVGIFAQQVNATPTSGTSGSMLFESAIASPPTMLSSDQLTLTSTVSL